MIVVGGLTRLTESGLSITEWRPVTGALPPSGEAAWTAEFEKYRASPQYEALNQGMTLAEFKRIYWWEWGHRQLGRLIGAVWALGFLWFALRRRIPPGWAPRLIGLGALGGLQGAIGWWMVALRPRRRHGSVASYRLAIHLGIAFAILGLIAWYVLRLSRPEAELLQARRQRNDGLVGWGTALLAVAFVQIAARGAGRRHRRRARAITDWPLMGGQVVPAGRLRACSRSGRTSSRTRRWCSSTTGWWATCCSCSGFSPGCAAGRARSGTFAGRSRRCC